LKSQEGARSTIASIWHNVQELCRNFYAIYFSYVNRSANGVAHCCAKQADPISKVCTWVGGLANIVILLLH
ncbi:hypothetical protein BAE44_0005547, partial [Dichanthelium oligosanthes]